MIEVIILSIVQGITEFLPISSSAHLILISKYFNFSNENLTLDVSLHLGSLLAIIFYFKKELLDFINNKQLFLKIILSSVPVMFFGFLLIKLNLIDHLRDYKIIGWSTIIFAVLLYLSDRVKIKKSINLCIYTYMKVHSTLHYIYLNIYSSSAITICNILIFYSLERCLPLLSDEDRSSTWIGDSTSQHG